VPGTIETTGLGQVDAPGVTVMFGSVEKTRPRLMLAVMVRAVPATTPVKIAV